MPFDLVRNSVRGKLLASFAVLIALLAGVAAVSASSMGSLGSSHALLSKSVLPRVNAAAGVRAAASDMHFSQTEYALDQGASRKNYEADRAAFGEAMRRLRSVTHAAGDMR
ncbi:MAG: hypothetical protein QOE17_1875, partial [Gaiellales bacterium]|nr:hypothetical protein [Gaiellales bacterium]